MPRFFNTAGRCKPDIHFMLPPARRLPEVRQIIERQSYFVLHAPRQSGKTTALYALSAELTAEGRYAAAVVSMEAGAPFGDDPGAAEAAVLGAFQKRIRAQLPPELQPAPWPEAAPGDRVNTALAAWARACPRPVVLLIDEIDALRDDALLSVLRQLRDGHAERPHAFPWSIGLVGLRDVRDYKLASGSSGRLGTSSPFNILVKSLTLRSAPRAPSTSWSNRSRSAPSPATRSSSSTPSTPPRPASLSSRPRSIAPSISPAASPGSSTRSRRPRWTRSASIAAWP
jgi:hypothetical protein